MKKIGDNENRLLGGGGSVFGIISFFKCNCTCKDRNKKRKRRSEVRPKIAQVKTEPIVKTEEKSFFSAGFPFWMI